MAVAKGFQIPSLDGIRAIAFFIVFFSHVGLERFMPGGFGVTIFFFLSGYLITTLLRLERERTGRVSLRDFYVRRALRILPPMYLVLAGCTGLSFALGQPPSLGALLAQALQASNYHTIWAAGVGQPIGTHVYWSLAVEEHFYLVFPLALIVLYRRVGTLEGIRKALVGVVIGVAIWRLALVYGLHATAERTSLASDTRVDSILYGCILALWRNPALDGPQFPNRLVIAATVVAVPVLLWTVAIRNTQFRETLRYSIQGIALTPLFVAAIRFHDRFPMRLLNWAWVRRLGVWSYVLYLGHFAVVQTLRRSYPNTSLRATLIALGISIAIAAVVHRFVEAPIASLRKRFAHVGSP